MDPPLHVNVLSELPYGFRSGWTASIFLNARFRSGGIASVFCGKRNSERLGCVRFAERFPLCVKHDFGSAVKLRLFYRCYYIIDKKGGLFSIKVKKTHSLIGRQRCRPLFNI
jgi:hypothetical protein